MQSKKETMSASSTAHLLAHLRFAPPITGRHARLATGRAGSPLAGRVSHPLDDVIGPRFDTVWTRRALHVPETHRYTLSIASDDPSAVVTIFSCNATCGRADESTVVMIPAATIDYPTTLELDAGRHWLRIEQAADSGAAVTVHLERR